MATKMSRGTESLRPEGRRAFLKRMAGIGTSAGALAMLAACGGAPQTGAPTAVPAEGPTGASAGSATSAPAEAPNTNTALEPVELTYIYTTFVDGGPKDLPAVQDAMNEILKQKINATVKLQALDFAAFEDKMKLANASGEQYDIVFTAPWANNYYQNVSNGNFVGLDDLLTQYAPGLWASMPPTTWEAARVQGKIYGVINQQIFVKPWGPLIRKDLADKYKLDLASINKYEDLEPFLKAIKDGEPDVTPLYSDSEFNGSLFAQEYFGFDPIISTAAVRYDDSALKVLNTVETPEFKQSVELAHKWYSAGYFTSEPIPAADGAGAFKAGKYALIAVDVLKPGNELEKKARYGFDFVQKSLTKAILTTGGTVATMNAISRTSKNPERAMMFLELLNTDKQLYNLLCKGIESKHWVWVDQAKQVIGFPQGVTAETSTYNPNTDWMFGNQFNAYYVDPTQVGNWEATAKLNQEATPSAALGFSFVTDKIKTELAQLDAVGKEYGTPLSKGMVDPATALPEYIAKQKEAGIDTVIAEVQRQIDEWKQAKK